MCYDGRRNEVDEATTSLNVGKAYDRHFNGYQSHASTLWSLIGWLTIPWTWTWWGKSYYNFVLVKFQYFMYIRTLLKLIFFIAFSTTFVA